MENIFKNLHSNQKILIYEMLKRGINVELLSEKLELIKTSYQGHVEFIYDRDSSIMPYHVSVLAGNKGITKKILQDNGISVPIGEVFPISEYDAILEAFHILDCPVVLKPVFGSHGYDVYTNITSEKELLEAIEKMVKNKGLQTKVLIEEFYPAKEYRVFVTKNRNYAVLHRDPAHVFGNGVNTIKELIDMENYRRMAYIKAPSDIHELLQEKLADNLNMDITEIKALMGEEADATNVDLAIEEGAPQLAMETEVTVTRNSFFNPLSYIIDLKDDIDSAEYLLSHGHVEGNVDIQTPGTYALTFYVTDSDGNNSNSVTVHVTVVE